MARALRACTERLREALVAIERVPQGAAGRVQLTEMCSELQTLAGELRLTLATGHVSDGAELPVFSCAAE